MVLATAATVVGGAAASKAADSASSEGGFLNTLFKIVVIVGILAILALLLYVVIKVIGATDSPVASLAAWVLPDWALNWYVAATGVVASFTTSFRGR